MVQQDFDSCVPSMDEQSKDCQPRAYKYAYLIMQDLANCMWGFVLASHGGTEPMECLELATSTCFLFLFGSLCFSLLLLNSNGNIQLPIVFILIILCSSR